MDLPLEERGRDIADLPGGASGLLVRDYKGKFPDEHVVTRVDSGIVSLLGELRAHEQQAAQELSQRQIKAVVEQRKVIDASPAAVALGMVCSREVLLEMKRNVLELQKA